MSATRHNQLTVARNASWLVAQRMAMTLVAIVVTAMVARYLGTHDYGLLLLALSYAALFAPLGTLGLRPHSVREIAAGAGAVPVIEEMLALRFALSLLAAGAALAYLWLFEGTVPAALVLVVVLLLLVNTMANCFIDGLYGVEEIRAVALVMAASGLTIQAGCVAAILADAGVAGVGAAYTAGAVVALVLARHYFLRHAGGLRIRRLTRAHFSHVQRSWTFFFQSVVHAVRSRIDVVVINALLGAHAAGVYGSAQALVERLDQLHDGLSTALFPRVAGLHAQADPALAALVRSTIKVVLVISVPMAVGLIGTWEGIVRLLFGDAFARDGPVLAILGVGIPFSFLHGVLFNVLTAMGLQKRVFWITVAATGVGVGAMAAGIALRGLPGAAAGIVAGQVTVALSLAVVYARRHGAPIGAADLGRLALANALMGAVLWWLRDAALAVQLAACATLYSATVLAINLVSLDTLRAMLRRPTATTP